MNTLQDYRSIRAQKFTEFKKKRDRKILVDYFNDHDYPLEKIDEISDNNHIQNIQTFIRRYRLSDKTPANDVPVTEEPIVKYKHRNQIYALPLSHASMSIDLAPFLNPVTRSIMSGVQLKRLVRKIEKLTTTKFDVESPFHDITGFYNNFDDSWSISDIYRLFGTKGINEIKLPKSVYDEFLELDPGHLYGVEIINNDHNNYKRTYASFSSIPSHGNGDNDRIELPMNIYRQLGVQPDDDEDHFKIRMIKPQKAKKVYLRSLVKKENLIQDVEKTFTQEINIHKVLTEGQIIIIESDKDNQMIPFLVEKTEPPGVVTTVNTDVEVDFLEAYDYDDATTALLIELNK